MSAKEKPLSREKIAIVHVAAHQLGMNDADYRALLMSTAGVNSSSGLNEAGFRAVMLRMEKLGFTHAKPTATAPATPAPQYGRRDGMATPAQVNAILRMWARWHGHDDARALGHWLERSFHVSDLRFVDTTTAQKAIEGLKAMIARKKTTTPRTTRPTKTATPAAGDKP
jgi:hypothetical protein